MKVYRVFSGSVAGSVHQDLVAGVDQSVEQGFGDYGLENRLYQSSDDLFEVRMSGLPLTARSLMSW